MSRSMTSSRPASGGWCAPTPSSGRTTASTPRITAWPMARATRSSGRSPMSEPTWPRSRRSIRPACRPRPLRTGPRDPRSSSGALRRRGRAPLGAPIDGARHARRHPVPDVRPRLRPAQGSARVGRPPGWTRSRRSSSSTRPGPAVPRSGCGSRSRTTPRPSCRRSSPRWSPPGRAAGFDETEQRRLADARRQGVGTRSRRIAAGCARRSPMGPTTGRSAGNDTRSSSPCGPSTASMSTTSSRSDSSSWRGIGRHGPRPRGRSTRASTRRRSSTGSSQRHPSTFDEALEAYRDAMVRARQASHRA